VGNSAAGGSTFAAIPRMYDPMQYFHYSQIPYDVSDDKQRIELYKWLEFFYKTHHLVPILIDIFTRFPLVGLDFYCPDKELKTFYEDLFFDKLDYEHFLVDLGRMYWTLGQAFPLGHFNESLGVWEDEELLDPSVIKVRKYPIIGGDQIFLTADGLKELKEIVEKEQPREMFYLLQRDYPEFIPFLKQGKDIPVSPTLLRQVAFKANPNDTYGTPILLRALRTLMHEEKLLASQDAIAERLYSPLILAKLGVMDMGQGRGPWIPGPEDTAEVRDQLDLALSSDFRLMVHHFGIEVQNVFGREQMPRLGDDFDRIEKRTMQVFGINPSLLSGGAASQPYASSALQAEFVSQILRTYQGYLKRHFEARAKVVAEAQEHYAYEKRGDSRIPIMEEVLEWDPETGEQVIVEKHKLLIPELRMKVLDLRDEATQRQFQQALKQQGVPLPDQDMAMGMHYDFNEALATSQEEMIQKTVATQEAKVKTYDILTAKGLPIPPDLKAEIEGMANFQGPQPGDATTLDVNPPQVGESIVMPPLPEGTTPAIGPRDPMRGDRPEESDERNPLRPPGQMANPAGPTIPGVPGQPGLLGVPGAPQPAIPAARSKTLPRKKAKDFTINKLIEESTPAIMDEKEKKLKDSKKSIT
jgi:hypothetical protein